MRWKFSGVCEKYEGWMFVEDDRGGLVMIRRELVRTRKCSSKLLFFTLPTYLSIPEVCKQAQVWQSCIPGVFRACLPTCAYLLPYLGTTDVTSDVLWLRNSLLVLPDSVACLRRA